jgi:pimeloyl-ACP methyl ester carboxylesterase
MRRFSLVTAEEPEFEVQVLDEDRVRDQLSVAEELVYVGHREPALVAAGAALEGAIRLAAGAVAGPTASAGALLEALLAFRALDDREHEQVFEVLAARDRVTRGFAPRDPRVSDPKRLTDVLGIAIRLLEPSPGRQSEN